jgi:putative phosphoesterase
MVIGLISDIHGNYAALTAVLASAREKHVTRFICAGDLVGYYYETAQCLQDLQNLQVDCVSGNHDRMLVEMSTNPTFAESMTHMFGSGHSVACEMLTSQQITWLRNLPTTLDFVINGRKITVAHGSPWSDTDYVYSDAKDLIDKIFQSVDFDVIVLGNTHRQLQVIRNGRCLVNPGSVGQPRGDQRGMAQWALLDTDNMSVRFLSEPYDNTALANEARRRDPSIPYLWEVLGERPA